MIQRYSMLPDSRDLFVEISLEGYSPTDLFCTGIQKLETNNEGFIDKKGMPAHGVAMFQTRHIPNLLKLLA